ncbi:hypothetical protein ANTRET_LOCUS7256 [Anthophora retusa]
MQTLSSFLGRMDTPGSEYYRTTQKLMSIIGLSPYKCSKYTRFWNAFIIIFLCSGVMVQLLALFTKDMNWKELVQTFSYFTISLSYVLKYLTFLIHQDTEKEIYDRIRNDWIMLTNKEELRIMHKYSSVTRTAIICFTFIICPSLMVLIFDILKSSILDILFPLNYTCPRTFPITMEYFVDQQKYFYLIAAHIIIVNTFGAIILLSTEVSAVTLVQHICGLYKIVSYRIDHTFVSNIPGLSPAERNIVVHRRIVSLVNLHKRVKEYVSILQKNYTTTYFLLFVFGIVVCTLSAPRFVKAIMNNRELDELFTFLFFTCGILCYEFIANHFAQEIIDHSSHILIHVYNTEWYKISLAEQKLLLILMQRCLKNESIVLGGIITASHNGFLLGIQTSFSYFMLIYSID